MNIRAATAEDAQAFWGKTPPGSIRAYVAELDGKVKGIAGLAYAPNQIIAFADMAEDGQKYPMTIMRMVKLVKALLDQTTAPVYCTPDVNLPRAKNFLEHIGFKPWIGQTFIWSKK